MDNSEILRVCKIDKQAFCYFSIEDFGKKHGVDVNKYPHSLKILLENLLRHKDGDIVTDEDIFEILDAFERGNISREIPFFPARVLLQDFSGIPLVVDLAAMRNVMAEWELDPGMINPKVTAHMIVDHSLQVDFWGCPDAVEKNMREEFKRNEERYCMLKWAQEAFDNFSVIPPGNGIIHQINLEHLATVVRVSSDSPPLLYPDTVVGTDSHTTMVNALGIVGWGVGGIEAEAVLLGQPYYFPVPRVVGVRLVGKLPPRSTATDVVLLVTEELRKIGVVGKFVEFFGPAWEEMSLPDRATLANMAPEYGATMGFCPVDERTLKFLRSTGKRETPLSIVEVYIKQQGLFGGYRKPENVLFENVVEIDVSKAFPCVAGPKRPQDRVPCNELPSKFPKILKRPKEKFGYALSDEEVAKSVKIRIDNDTIELRHGSVVLAAITSCTNTSNPQLIVTAALLARNARMLGLKAGKWVKTSFTPGSRATAEYLRNLGLLKDLETVGFGIAGYGCATCIGNSGPLIPKVSKAIKEHNLVACAVVSANRNFEGRVHADIRANFLASPPLVVAYAISGRIDIDWEREPMGRSIDGRDVYLRDIWPEAAEVEKYLGAAFDPGLYERLRSSLFNGNALWQTLSADSGELFSWNDSSTYLRRPSFLEGLSKERPQITDIEGARVLVYLGDSVTTDHISPAGAIPQDSPAGEYLKKMGVSHNDFNSYGARRGNHEVMVRGTFANVRLKNKLVPGKTGGWTVHFPSGEICTVWDASCRYRRERVPLIVLAGKEYGTGSSRDWAAKGTALLGVKTVIAESFERIHRSNLIGMGVLPLQFKDGESAEKLGLEGDEVYSIRGITEDMSPNTELQVIATKGENTKIFSVISRLDTKMEVSYFLHGGILPRVLREIAGCL